MQPSPNLLRQDPAKLANELVSDNFAGTSSVEHSRRLPASSLVSQSSSESVPLPKTDPNPAPRSLPVSHNDPSDSVPASYNSSGPAAMTAERPTLLIDSKDADSRISRHRFLPVTPAESPATARSTQSNMPHPLSDDMSHRHVESASNTPDKDHAIENIEDGHPPAWVGHKTKAGKERKRLPLACIACRRKKIRCSGEKPICKHCAKSRIPCVYKITTRKPAPRTDYMAMLDKRLRRMEDRVIKVMPKDDQRSATGIGRAVVKPALASQTSSATPKKRLADEAFAGHLSNWSKQEGSSNDRPSKPQSVTAQPDIIADGKDKLPSFELQEHLTEIYFEFVYGQAYQLLHKPTYLKRLRAGQLPSVLNLAVCAVSARFSDHPYFGTETAYLRGEEWAAPAREICLRRFDTPNLTIIMVYLLLGLHEFGTCHGGRSWMFGGSAQRMAYALQLHKNLDPSQYKLKGSEGRKLPQTDRETRLRTMWACFIMDRFNSAGTDRPPFVAQQYIEVKMPIKESLYLLEIAGPTEGLEPVTDGSAESHENMGVSAYMIRAIAIWGDVVRYMNLGGRERDEYQLWMQESGFHSLWKQLETFKASLPANMAWSRENLETHAGEGIANQYIFMHIVQQQIGLYMHRVALPNLAGQSMPKSAPQDFTNGCVRAALQAANQTSILLREASKHRVTAPFAGYSAYLSGTVHVVGLSSKSAAVLDASRKALDTSMSFLLQLRQYWGMFHTLVEHLKELIDHAQPSSKPTQARAGASEPVRVLQYGDWFAKYPNGIHEDSSNKSPDKSTVDNNDKIDELRHHESIRSGDTATTGNALDQSSTTTATGKKNEQNRRRVKSLGIQAQDSSNMLQRTSPTEGPATAQYQTPNSLPLESRATQLLTRRTYPEPQMPDFRSAMPADAFDHVAQGPIFADQSLHAPNLQHTVLDYMSNQSLQTQHGLMAPLLPPQQPSKQRPNMIPQLSQSLMTPSYNGLVSSTQGDDLSGTMQSAAASPSFSISAGNNFVSGNNMSIASTMAQDPLQGSYSNMAGSHGPGRWNDASSAWFMPFNFDPRSSMSAQPMPASGNTMGLMNPASPTSPVAMNPGFDLDAVFAGMPEFANDGGMNAMDLDGTAGLGKMV